MKKWKNEKQNKTNEKWKTNVEGSEKTTTCEQQKNHRQHLVSF